MEKALLVIDMPKEVCQKCRLCYDTHHDSYMCTGTGKEIPDGEIPAWCPLVEMPQKKDIKNASTMTDLGWIEGFNAFLDCILKKES